MRWRARSYPNAPLWLAPDGRFVTANRIDEAAVYASEEEARAAIAAHVHSAHLKYWRPERIGDVGDRVKVRPIASRWAYGAAAALDGKVGTVDRVRDDGAARVKLDTAPVSWLPSGWPCGDSWWFDADEIGEVG